jgi:hypothetical protein
MLSKRSWINTISHMEAAKTHLQAILRVDLGFMLGNDVDMWV